MLLKRLAFHKKSVATGFFRLPPETEEFVIYG